MRTLRLFVVAALISAGLVHAPSASAAKSLSATLSGTNEIPSGSGDTDGSGTATITIKKKKRTLCWRINYEKIDAPNAGHIHDGGPTAEGGIVLLLFSGTIESGATDCVKVRRSDAAHLVDDAANHYVNIHNSAFPDGAIRGQLQLQS